MLGIVDYSDSDAEGEPQEPQRAGPPAGGSGAAAANAPAAQAQQLAGRLPSAEALLGAGSAAVRLPPPNFGQPAIGRSQAPPAAQHPAAAGVSGSKRGQPDTRGPLPNPMSLDNKLQRGGGATNVGGARPGTLPGGLLLPPQLRGRANVATEDLGSMFTHQSRKAAQQRSGDGSQPP